MYESCFTVHIPHMEWSTSPYGNNQNMYPGCMKIASPLHVVVGSYMTEVIWRGYIHLYISTVDLKLNNRTIIAVLMKLYHETVKKKFKKTLFPMNSCPITTTQELNFSYRFQLKKNPLILVKRVAEPKPGVTIRQRN